MLQELYSETGAAAQAIVEEVAPAVNETTKEEIAGAAVDRAEAIADNIADTVKLEQSEHAAIVEACAQVIYAETLAELADNAKVTALESLFTEEYVQETYAALEAQEQETYGEKADKVKAHLKGNARIYGDAAGAAAGAGVGFIAARRAAKAKNLQPGTPEYKKFIAKYMAGGAAAGVATAEVGRAGYRGVKKFNAMRKPNKTGDYDGVTAKGVEVKNKGILKRVGIAAKHGFGGGKGL
jgi:hypothetical protein